MKGVCFFNTTGRERTTVFRNRWRCGKIAIVCDIVNGLDFVNFYLSFQVLDYGSSYFSNRVVIKYQLTQSIFYGKILSV